MAEVKRCQLNDCHRAASAFCYCCQKSTCTQHFIQHIDNVRAQIDPLADAVNRMVEKIQVMTAEQLTETSFKKLDQWKCDMHQLIDQIFSNKRKEIEDIVENNQENFLEHQIQQKDNVMKIQQEVKQLVEDGDATFQQIESLKKQLEKIETKQKEFKKQFLSIHTQVSDPQFVTVSSTLNNLNTSFAALASFMSHTNNPGFAIASPDLSWKENAYPINSTPSNIRPTEVSQTATGFNRLLFTSNDSNSGDNPFASLEKSIPCKRILRGRRRQS